MLGGDPGPLRSRSGIESAFISRSWTGFVQPRMGRQFAGFGVGRGSAIWGPFPVHAPDNAPETWTWSTRTESLRFRRWAWVCHLGPLSGGAPDSAPETWTWSTRSEGGRQLAGLQPRRKPNRVEVPNMRWTCCRWCLVARADRESQVSALGVGLSSGAPFRCTHRITHRKRGPLSTRTLRCTLPFQLSMAGVALLALVALFLPTATLASTRSARRLCA